MEEEYISPFDKSLDKSLLYHLSSDITVLPEIATDILSIPTHGLQMSTKFKEERLLNATVKFHDPISRNKFKLFKDIGKKLSITKINTTKVIEANRNVLGTLLACTAKYEKPLDFEKVLSYPLAPVPLSIANADGILRSTPKSNINKIIMKDYNLITTALS